MLESYETTDRAQLEEAYRDPTQLEMRRGMGEYKKPRINLQSEVLKAINLKKGEFLLEVGCGKGELVNSFPEDGSSIVIGSDLVPGMIREASRKSRRFIVSDSQRIPFRPSVFDAVAAVNMIYHVPDKNAALSEMSRVLKEGGRLVLTGHSVKDRDLSRRLRESAALNFGVANYPHPPAKFNTENGLAVLRKYFPRVELKLYTSVIVVPEITPHLDFFDSMRHFWGRKFTDDEWQAMLNYAEKFLELEIETRGFIEEEAISGIFICRK